MQDGIESAIRTSGQANTAPAYDDEHFDRNYYPDQVAHDRETIGGGARNQRGRQTMLNTRNRTDAAFVALLEDYATLRNEFKACITSPSGRIDDDKDRVELERMNGLIHNCLAAMGVPAESDDRQCRGCGCTQHNACTVAGPDGQERGCSWVEEDLCSACAAPWDRIEGPVPAVKREL